MKRIVLLLVLFAAAAVASAQAPAGDEAAIRAAITAQADAWNRADIPIFMQTYENSPDTTFVGTKVSKGFEPILKHYQAAYTNAAQMGKLSFTDLEVRLLPSSSGATEYAAVTGKFHLERTEKGAAKKDDGIFSLIWRKGPQGWKIILDHTS